MRHRGAVGLPGPPPAAVADDLLQYDDPLDDFEQEAVISGLEAQAAAAEVVFSGAMCVLGILVAAFFLHASLQQARHPWTARYTGELRTVLGDGQGPAIALFMQGAGASAAAAALASPRFLPSLAAALSALPSLLATLVWKRWHRDGDSQRGALLLSPPPCCWPPAACAPAAPTCEGGAAGRRHARGRRQPAPLMPGAAAAGPVLQTAHDQPLLLRLVLPAANLLAASGGVYWTAALLRAAPLFGGLIRPALWRFVWLPALPLLVTAGAAAAAAAASSNAAELAALRRLRYDFKKV